eukprot:jgi/Mesvir1/14895/Mv05498-RA.3
MSTTISKEEIYNCFAVIVPLYLTILVGWLFSRYQKMTKVQLSGIQTFIMSLAVPAVVFQLLSKSNLYTADYSVVLADTLYKVALGVGLWVWYFFLAPRTSWMRRHGTDDDKLGGFLWSFNVATLPNTLIIGVPLISAMYGKESETTMILIVVAQTSIQVVFLVVLYELRKVLVQQREVLASVRHLEAPLVASASASAIPVSLTFPPSSSAGAAAVPPPRRCVSEVVRSTLAPAQPHGQAQAFAQAQPQAAPQSQAKAQAGGEWHPQRRPAIGSPTPAKGVQPIHTRTQGPASVNITPTGNAAGPPARLSAEGNGETDSPSQAHCVAAFNGPGTAPGDWVGSLPGGPAALTGLRKVERGEMDKTGQGSGGCGGIPPSQGPGQGVLHQYNIRTEGKEVSRPSGACTENGGGRGMAMGRVDQVGEGRRSPVVESDRLCSVQLAAVDVASSCNHTVGNRLNKQMRCVPWEDGWKEEQAATTCHVATLAPASLDSHPISDGASSPCSPVNAVDRSTARDAAGTCPWHPARQGCLRDVVQGSLPTGPHDDADLGRERLRHDRAADAAGVAVAPQGPHYSDHPRYGNHPSCSDHTPCSHHPCCSDQSLCSDRFPCSDHPRYRDHPRYSDHPPCSDHPFRGGSCPSMSSPGCDIIYIVAESSKRHRTSDEDVSCEGGPTGRPSTSSSSGRPGCVEEGGVRVEFVGEGGVTDYRRLDSLRCSGAAGIDRSIGVPQGVGAGARVGGGSHVEPDGVGGRSVGSTTWGSDHLRCLERDRTEADRRDDMADLSPMAVKLGPEVVGPLEDAKGREATGKDASPVVSIGMDGSRQGRDASGGGGETGLERGGGREGNGTLTPTEESTREGPTRTTGVSAAALLNRKMITAVVLKNLVHNPIIQIVPVAITYSLLAFRFDFGVPTMLDNFVRMFSNTVFGLAVFTLGMFIHAHRLMSTGSAYWVASLLFIRFLLAPLGYAVISWAVGLSGTLLKVMIVQVGYGS